MSAIDPSRPFAAAAAYYHHRAPYAPEALKFLVDTFGLAQGVMSLGQGTFMVLVGAAAEHVAPTVVIAANGVIGTVAAVAVGAVAAVVAGAVFVATMVATSANSTLMASGYAAGAAVALYGLGPGSSGPRREVTRIVRAVARTRTTAIIAALIMYCLAAAMVAEALSQPPILWPDISQWLPHLPNVNTMLHLPHLGLPHFGVGPSRLR